MVARLPPDPTPSTMAFESIPDSIMHTTFSYRLGRKSLHHTSVIRTPKSKPRVAPYTRKQTPPLTTDASPSISHFAATSGSNSAQPAAHLPKDSSEALSDAESVESDVSEASVISRAPSPEIAADMSPRRSMSPELGVDKGADTAVISKPAGEAGRRSRGGYNLAEEMGWGENDYKSIFVSEFGGLLRAIFDV